MAKKRKKKKTNPAARIADVFFSLVLVAGVGFGGYHVVSNGVKIDQTTTYYNPDTEEPTEPEPDENAIVYGNTEIPNTEVYNGPLVLVNYDAPCMTGENGLISLGIRKLETENHSFAGVTDNSLLVTEETANALLEMFDAFYEATFDDNIVVVSGYRSQERQQELYDEDLAQTGLDYSERVALPGYSEHQTGLGVDLELVDGEYDGTGIYEWIDAHCAEFGLILRYPENKQEITHITYEPWHYRYVGKPHASVIMGRGLCLEEYIDLVKEYPYDGEHLQVTDTDGTIYEIYYYAENTDYDSTMVPIPGGGLNYTVCGNNVDGFVIAVDTGLKEEVPPVGDDSNDIETEETPENDDTIPEEDGNMPEDEE